MLDLIYQVPHCYFLFFNSQLLLSCTLCHNHYMVSESEGCESFTSDKRSTQTNPNPQTRKNKKKMDRGMGGALPIKKLDRSNYASWEYKMHQYVFGHGYFSYIHGENEVAPKSAHKDFPVWEQATSRVLHCLVSCVHDKMLGYIRMRRCRKRLGKI